MNKFIQKFKNGFVSRHQLQLIVLMCATVIVLSCLHPFPAYANVDPEASARSFLRFIALLILCAAGGGALKSIASGHMVPAVILVLGGAFLSTALDPDLMSAIGNGISSLLKLKSS